MARMSELEVFVQVAKHGSLTMAAERLDISNAAASRQLAALERRLSARLIERNTRRISLTLAGAEFFERCEGLLSDLKEAEAAVSAAVREPKGKLLVAAPAAFSARHIVPLLPEFGRRHPGIEVQLLAGSRHQEPVGADIDLAIRIREFEPDASFSVRRLARTRRVLAASPRYLDRESSPQSVDALAGRPFLIDTDTPTPLVLSLSRAGEQRTIRIRGVLRSDDGHILRAAALLGLGILALPRSLIDEDIAAGRLVPLLDDWHLPPVYINAAFRNRRYLSAKARLFLDFVCEHFLQHDHWKPCTD